MILVAAEADGAASRRVASVLLSRLRPTDRLCRLDGRGFLVVAPDTDLETADALAADWRRHLDRANGGPTEVAIEVHGANGEATTAELLERVTDSQRTRRHAGAGQLSRATMKAPSAAARVHHRRKRCGLALILALALSAAAPTAAIATVAFSAAPNAPNLPSLAINAQAQTLNATMADWGSRRPPRRVAGM